MTLSDQKNLKNLLEMIPKTKKLLIIHNFFNLHYVEDVELYIEKDILKGVSSVNLLEKDFDKSRKVKFYIEKDKDIAHLVISNDFSKSGKYYNPPAFKFIQETIINFTNVKNFEITNNLLNFIKQEKHKYLKNHEELTYILKKSSQFKSIIEIADNKEPILKKPTLNYLGFIQTKENNNITYSIIKNNLKGNLLFQIFIPGINDEIINNIHFEIININEEFFCFKIIIDFKTFLLNKALNLNCNEEEMIVNFYDKYEKDKKIEILTCQFSYYNNHYNCDKFEKKVIDGIVNLTLIKIIDKETFF